MKKKYYKIIATGLIAVQSCIGLQALGPTMVANRAIHETYHVIVNKQNPVDQHFKPKTLVIPKVRFQTPGNIDKNYMEREAAYALENMFKDAAASGITLVAVSGYRSYDYQNNLYQNALRKYGRNQNGTATPNDSEHRTGLAMDVTGISGGTIEESFEHTKEGQWLAANCYKYGYIIRYPKNKTAITGYIYEPWHIRYVGKELATQLHTNGLAMEELARCCYEKVEMSMEIDGVTGHQKVSVVEDQGTLYIDLEQLGQRIGGSVGYTAITQMSTLTYGKYYLVAGPNWLNGGGEKNLTLGDTLYVPLRKTCGILGLKLVEVNTQQGKIKVATRN
ncbi:MAG: M15 family metallopeptidase [Niameybacter sp.]|uniref:M15 family metallopeptidase n=1 Tax=Niameybacter sp. TaxID=2033640 RepID=UPI002FCBCC28